MNSTTIKFSVTKGDEEQFLNSLKKERIPFVTTCDGDTEYKYYSVVPVYLENDLQNSLAEKAKQVNVNIKVHGMYQDPGTGEANVWEWKM